MMTKVARNRLSVVGSIQHGNSDEHLNIEEKTRVRDRDRERERRRHYTSVPVEPSVVVHAGWRMHGGARGSMMANLFLIFVFLMSLTAKTVAAAAMVGGGNDSQRFQRARESQRCCLFFSVLFLLRLLRCLLLRNSGRSV